MGASNTRVRGPRRNHEEARGLDSGLAAGWGMVVREARQGWLLELGPQHVPGRHQLCVGTSGDQGRPLDAEPHARCFAGDISLQAF